MSIQDQDFVSIALHVRVLEGALRLHSWYSVRLNSNQTHSRKLHSVTKGAWNDFSNPLRGLASGTGTRNSITANWTRLTLSCQMLNYFSMRGLVQKDTKQWKSLRRFAFTIRMYLNFKWCQNTKMLLEFPWIFLPWM